MPPCYRSLATVAFAYQKASTITTGHPVTPYTTHALHTLLTSQTFVITNSHHTGYDSILSSQELTIEHCTMVNPADKLITPVDGTPHKFVSESEKFLKVRPDLENQPLKDTQYTWVLPLYWCRKQGRICSDWSQKQSDNLWNSNEYSSTPTLFGPATVAEISRWLQPVNWEMAKIVQSTQFQHMPMVCAMYLGPSGHKKGFNKLTVQP